MKTIHKKILVMFFLISLCFFVLGIDGRLNETDTGMMILKLEKQNLTLAAREAKILVNGEIIYKVVPAAKGVNFELSSFSLIGSSIKTKRGESGVISMILKPQSARSTYIPKNRIIKSEFLLEVHYPLIDQIKGYMSPTKGERELDDYRSYTETFSGSITCQLSEPPRIDTKEWKFKEGVSLMLKLEPKEKVLGEISILSGKFKISDVMIWPKFYFRKIINIQPVFVRYTPAEGCFGGAATATTGGSFPTLREKSIEMWNRCCIRLNFLTPVFIDSDDYRILSSSEEAALKAAYDDPNSIEVYFVEVGDPVGIHGGGVCYSSGTANAKVITYDTNLPINLYNLAHELGHAFGLMHPPGNATPGSLMEPSGFCADNPALMSKQNCDNASNPLFATSFPFQICLRDINMD